jgi:hypothetical protein
MLPSTPLGPLLALPACYASEREGANHVSTVAAAIQGAKGEAVDVAFVDYECTAAGSADIELSVLQRQCLDRRLGNRATMGQEVAAWVAARNETATSIDWHFRTSDARIKLKRLYPVIQA